MHHRGRIFACSVLTDLQICQQSQHLTVRCVGTLQNLLSTPAFTSTRCLLFLCWEKCSSFFNLQTITGALFHTNFGILSKQKQSLSGVVARQMGLMPGWGFHLVLLAQEMGTPGTGGTWVAGGRSPSQGVREQQR